MVKTHDPLKNEELRAIVGEVFGVKLDGHFICFYKAGDCLVLASEKQSIGLSYPDSEKKAVDLLVKLGLFHPGIKTFEMKPSDNEFPMINLSMYLLNAADNGKDLISTGLKYL